jgi:uncharacterized protein YraI
MRLWILGAVVVITIMLGGCGLFGRGEPATPTPAAERELVPTFTPTPLGAEPEAATPAQEVAEAPAAEAPAAEAPAEEAQPEQADAAPAEEATPTPEPPTPEPEPTATPAAKLVVQTDNVNVRNGPGTNYGIAGAVRVGQAFDITGKNPQGDWWEFCCLNGQKGWIYADLVTTENADSVAVAENIPEAPVAEVVQEPQTQPEAPAQEAPAQEAPAEEPAPAPSGDPCAGIGGDGCKWHVRNGPSFGGNGGTEIKLQLLFIHSGIDGGQPQGSYFVVVMKDGVKLPISDGVRSIALSKTDGPLGAFNYEYKIGIGDIPGGTVAGNYVMYVLDGNGERDSQDFGFSIPDGQGDVWIEWDQA